jgi:hypothetical protein
MSFIGSLIWLMEKAYNYDRAKEAMTIKKAAKTKKLPEMPDTREYLNNISQ